MLLFLFLFGLALGAESEVQSDDPAVEVVRGSCPDFWSSFNNTCYKYISTHFTWADAELHCVSEGANLVSIHTMEERNFIKALIKNFDPADGHTWIGLSDVHKEGKWMWSDGSPVDFLSWSSGQPDNSGGHENCVHIKHGTDYRWNDLKCSATFPSVCKSHKICP